MRFLRMLTNSLLAGALGAAYLTILVLQLNPHVPLASDTTWRWFATLGLFYGIHLAVLFYVLMIAREFFSLDSLSPGWVSVRVLAWLASALAATASVLMWLNVQGFEAALGETAARRMTAGAAATSASAAVLFGIAVAHYSFGRRGSRVGASLFGIAVLGSLALPLAARGPATEPPVPRSAADGPVRARPAVAGEPSDRRVVMILLDGAALDYIWPRAAEGRLPNFARLLDAGARLDLATVRPTGPAPVWASVASGFYPDKTGIRSGASYVAWNADRALHLLPDHCFSHTLVHLGVIRQDASSSAEWSVRPIWDILSQAGIPVGIVRWPLTYPAPAVDAFVVSERYHSLLGSMRELDEGGAYPADILPIVRSAFVSPPADHQVPPRLAGTSGSGDEPSPEVSAGAWDAAYAQSWRALRASRPVRFAALRYQGLDTVGHFYMGDAQPGLVSDSSEPDRRRHVQVVDRYYAYIDAEIGTAIDALAPGDLLLVVSGFGMQRQKAWKQLVGRALGDPGMTGTHDRAPDGFLLAYGVLVERGRPQRGSIVDVAPTVLYYLGLPIGRDMDGYARTDIFRREFTSERPIAFVPSYNY